jgi:uncharacterized protein (DUF2267 family)
MQFDDMTDYVLEHTAINERAEAIHWLEETLTAFAKCLTPAEAQRLALEVPAPASHWIRDVEIERRFDRPQQLYDLVGQHLDVSTGVAMERAQVAVLALARELRPDTRQWLVNHMGESWQSLFEERSMSASRSSKARRSHVDRPEGARTLAEGRPGSATPLSEAAPEPQSGSVAEANPHEDRKVSSAQDVHAEPLSSSTPRSTHPISEGD